MISHIRTAAASVLISAASSVVAFAAPMAYTSSADFITDTSTYTMSFEGYEGFNTDDLIANGSSTGGIGYSFTSSDAIDGRIDSTFNNEGNNSLAVLRSSGINFFIGGESITFTFDIPVNAFGLIVNIFESATDVISLSGNGLTAVTGSGPYDSDTFYFLGLTSDIAFNTATLSVSNLAVSGYNVDSLRFGTAAAAVDEPGMMALFGLGLMGLALRTRRKSQLV
jgi:hypothetical protein